MDEYLYRGRKTPPPPSDDLPLFAAPMNHRTDPAPATEAADRVRAGLSELQARVFAAIEVAGPITAVELEALPAFAGLAPSTVRKRVSELARAGQIVPTGSREVRVGGRTTKATTYRATDRQDRGRAA